MKAVRMPGSDDHFPQTTDASATADVGAWIAVASGLVQLRLSNVRGPADAPALRLDYDFGGGGGFAVARREVVLDLPEAWELRVFVRGEAPANTLEIKFVDVAGSSVWRWKREGFALSREWTELCIASRNVEFAWGPAGGGSIRRTSALEVAVVAGPGGSGFFEIAGFHFHDRSPNRAIALEASSSAPGTSIAAAIDDDAKTRWRSAPGPGPHALTMDFGEARDLGGVVVQWDASALPASFRVEVSGEGDAWAAVYDAPLAGATLNFVPLAAVSAKRLRLVSWALHAAAGVGVVSIEVKPVEWTRSPSEFLTNVGRGSRRGAWPRYLRREQTCWTPVATPVGGPVGLINDDGAVEVGEGGFLLEPSLLHSTEGGTGDPPRWITWADVTGTVTLAQHPLPVATVAWQDGDLGLEVTAAAEDGGDTDVLLVRYRLTNAALQAAQVTLGVALRPLQVTPPWQAFRRLGGASPISRLEWDGSAVTVNGETRVLPLTAAPRFGAAGFDEGGVAAALADGRLPLRTTITDSAGRAEGVLAFDVVVAAASSADVFVECRFPRRRSPALASDTASVDTVSDAARETEKSARGATPEVREATDASSARIATAIDVWRLALPLPTLSACEGAMLEHDGAVTAIAHILACRDGAALQPGPRRYTRSWIRDGAIMAAALARSGRGGAAREFIEWYAPLQRDDGFVPCCVDRDGVDPLVEHDSHGQLVHAVAESYRFTRDAAFARSLWPRCAKAAEFIEALRATRKTDEFVNGARRSCHGLLPESVSHEGYLSQPVHSYWDDFWALRGLRDAAFLARELELPAEAERWSAAAEDLAGCIAASIRTVMTDRTLVTVPASVEWADFDPTAIAGAISLVGAAEIFPADALAKTFDEYLRGFRAKRDGTVAWNNYTAYEVRIVGALVCLGRRDDANELLDFLLAERRPAAWGQWPEITWRDATAPAHLGDLPHCWIGAEYAIALRSMFVFERESDAALVIGAGLRRDWLDADGGIEKRNIPTWYGSLDLSIRRDAGGGYRVVVSGDARPPGGFVADLPGGVATIEERR